MVKLVIDIKELDLLKTMQSGQVFRYVIIDASTYVLIFKSNWVKVHQIHNGYDFECDETTFNKIWYPYLDLGRNYQQANERIIGCDKRLQSIIATQQGTRILRQNPFEMLITFIISQSKAIPQIRHLVNQLSEEFGEEIGACNGVGLYSFPTPKALSKLHEMDFRERKFGYRAAYLVDAIEKSNNNSLDFEMLEACEDKLLLETLMTVKGVGRKVASCVMLFGYGRHHAFPIDVWMRRTVVKMYFSSGEKVSDLLLEAYGKQLFKGDAGIAQQYLFEYGRSKN